MFSKERVRVLCFTNKQGEFLAATHQCEALSVLWHQMVRRNFYVQIQVRQLEQEADARFFDVDPPMKQNTLLRIIGKFWKRKSIKEVWKRYEQVSDLRTDLSLQAPHAQDVSQQQNQEYPGLPVDAPHGCRNQCGNAAPWLANLLFVENQVR